MGSRQTLLYQDTDTQDWETFYMHIYRLARQVDSSVSIYLEREKARKEGRKKERKESLGNNLDMTKDTWLD